MKRTFLSSLLALVILVGIGIQPASAQDKRLDLFLGGSWFTSSDAKYKTIYGDSSFTPTFGLDFKILSRLSIWADTSFFSADGTIDLVNESASISQMHLGLGLGYGLLQTGPFALTVRGGMAFHRFQEEALDDTNSESALGFCLGLAGDYRLGYALSLHLGVDWKSVAHSNEFRDMNLGGLQLGLSIGYTLLRTEPSVKPVLTISEPPLPPQQPPSPPIMAVEKPKTVEQAPPLQPKVQESVREPEPKTVADPAIADNDSKQLEVKLAGMEADAIRSFNNKDYATALKLFEAILKETPDKADLLTHQGLCRLHTKQYEAAKKSFKLSYERDQNAHRNLYYIGLVHDNLGQFDQALEYYILFRKSNTTQSGFKHMKWLNQRISFLQNQK